MDQVKRESKIDLFSDEEIVILYSKCNKSLRQFLGLLGYQSGGCSGNLVKKKLSERGFNFEFKKKSKNRDKLFIENKKIHEKDRAGLICIYHDYRSRSKKKNHEFELSVDYFSEIVKSNCSYCGSPPEQKKRKGNLVDANGIDRIDSSIGYVTGNIVPCCYMCNRMKSDHDLEEFKSHVKKIHNKMKLGDNE
jgi:hypothetical protein